MNTSKIIKGVVSNGRYTVTAPIVKEDYGLYLQIDGVELPETYQVDFSNDEHHGTSVTMIGNADGVKIPRQFIDTGKDVFAFLYWVGEDYGKTVYKFRIPNKLRPDRTNEEPTPEEQSVIDQAISALNSAVAQTAQDVIDADASAQSASADADRAEQAKNDAVESAMASAQMANSSANYASQASASATASAQSASQSAQIKTDVESLADDAQGYAQASAQSATASANSATSAQGYAQSASASAQSASGYASNAQTSAQTASAKAQDASTSAQTASQKATESAQSAENALTYKTDAESAKVASQTAQGLAESARDSAISAKNDAEQAKTDAESARDEAQNIVDEISGKVEQIDSNTERIESLEDDRYKPYPTDTASGAVASFTDGADDIPLKSLVVNIDPIQDTSSGDPSPTNICPISGWTEVGVEQSGKNLFDADAFATMADLTKNEDGSLYVSFNSKVLNKVAWKNVGYTGQIALTYTYKYANTSYNGAIPQIYYTDGTHENTSVSSTNEWKTITKISNASKIVDYVTFTYGTGANATTFFLQIELGSTATPYSPYTGRSITIDLGQTVYGGKLDVLTGELTVYPYYASYNGETLTGEWISDRDKYVSGTTPTIGAQVVNIGAQGVTVQLEPHEVESLYGVNNLWADSGDTEAVYRADTKLFIERLTAPDSADMVADANITSGQYFMVGNSLYKATANIANGGQIIVGTNATRVSLAQALNEINA